MYSSLTHPTHDDWVQESNRLLEELEQNLVVYKEKIVNCQTKNDDFMTKYYCLKLLKANEDLRFNKISF